MNITTEIMKDYKGEQIFSGEEPVLPSDFSLSGTIPPKRMELKGEIYTLDKTSNFSIQNSIYGASVTVGTINNTTQNCYLTPSELNNLINSTFEEYVTQPRFQKK